MSATTISKPRQSTRFYLTLGILGFLALVGLAAGVYRMTTGLGASTDLSDGRPWGIWIGFDFSLIALSGAGFTLATAVHVLRMKKLKPALRPAILAGLVGYLAVLVILILDLGRPDRFYHFLIYYNLHSPMFEISWCILLYTIVLVIETSPFLFEKTKASGAARFVHKAVIPISVIGLVLSTLHQSTLGTLYLNMPQRLDELWYSPIMTLLFFVSSVMAGLAVAMITYRISTRMRGKEIDPAVTRSLAKGIAWVGLVYLGLKLVDIGLAGEMSSFLAFDRESLLLWLELGLGVLVPMVMFFVPEGTGVSLGLFNLRSGRETARGQWWGALLVIFGVVFNRFNATLLAMAPRGEASYTPHILEWATTVGVVAALALAWYLGIRYLAIFEGDVPAKA